MYRVMGDRLARTGFHVMRFDYIGTGDADCDDDAGDLSIWLEDVIAADTELARLTGHTVRSWFGLRLGATLAALASKKAPAPPRRLVLWDPVLDGSAYLNELARAHLDAYAASYGARWHLEPDLREQALQQSRTEALGFPLNIALREQLANLHPADLQSSRAGAAYLFSGPDAQFAGDVMKQVAAKGIDVRQSSIASRIIWASNEAMNSSIVPVDALAAVIGALTAD